MDKTGIKTMLMKEKGAKALFLVCALISIAAVLLICIYIFANAFPALAEIGIFRFLFGDTWSPRNGEFGILPMIVGSVFATVGALLTGVTLGVFSAVFIVCFCKTKLRRVFLQLVNLLAGIPSVIYGYFGIKVLSPLVMEVFGVSSGQGLFTVSIILGIMILPTIVSLTASGLEAVPGSYYEGALAIGANKVSAVFNVVLPAAKSSVMTSIILGLGRALGETMAVVMIAGNQAVIPDSLFTSFRTLTANIVFEMGYADSDTWKGALIATGAVLVFFVLIINLLLNAVRGRGSEQGMIKRYLRGTKILYVFSVFTFIISMISLSAILLYILVEGVPHIDFELLFGEFRYGKVTLLPAITGSLMIVLLSMAIALPAGIFAAVFLNEYTKKNSRLVKVIDLATETLAGVPSVIFGLFGYLFFSLALGMGMSLLSGSLTLSLMILPVIVRSTQEALKAVQPGLREGSLALGAGNFRTVMRVVLPAALPGIAASAILAVGRVMGESAPILLTSGQPRGMPSGYMSMGGNLAVMVYSLANEGLYPEETAACSAILILIVLGLNLGADFLTRFLRRKLGE